MIKRTLAIICFVSALFLFGWVVYTNLPTLLVKSEELPTPTPEEIDFSTAQTAREATIAYISKERSDIVLPTSIEWEATHLTPDGLVGLEKG